MDFTDSAAATTTASPSRLSSSAPLLSGSSSSQEDHYVASIIEDHEITCWGCGLRLLLSPYTPIFKCGWCGAITNHNATKVENKYFWWRRLRDRCLVGVLLLFMLFIIGSGIWAIYPVVFSMGYFIGIFHMTLALILSITTLTTYVLAAFRSPGAPPIIPWGSYPAVGKGGLDDYTFCHFCSKPKSPSAHHCRSCGMCVLDMDHHCPFIGNCVGVGNHRSFILFLISAVTSTFYVAIISSYTAYLIWPPIPYTPAALLTTATDDHRLFLRVTKELALSFLTSVEYLSVRGFVLVYLFIASISVKIGLAVLLWQQLCYIYEGKTYLSHLSSPGEAAEKDCQNIVRFFGCPYSTSRYLPSSWNPKKSHKK